jgi:hypothetical protein
MGTYIIGGILLLIITLIIYNLIRKKKHNPNCTDCAGCALSAQCHKEEDPHENQ